MDLITTIRSTQIEIDIYVKRQYELKQKPDKDIINSILELEKTIKQFKIAVLDAKPLF